MRARLQKVLAAAGVSSRRGAEELLKAGRVTVNGEIAKLGDSADPEVDGIALDGQPLRAEPLAYWLLNKPRGVLSTRRDTRGRRTVLDLLPAGEETRLRLYPVGRLDIDSEGLILLTNHGEVAHALLHPSLGSEREYRVTARGRITEQTARRLAGGVELEDGPTARARVSQPSYDARSDSSRLTMVLQEGRKRQIRRALAALGHPVVRLLRVRMGPLQLARLPSGEARPLTPRERDELLQHAASRLSPPSGGAGSKSAGGPGRPRSDRTKSPRKG